MSTAVEPAEPASAPRSVAERGLRGSWPLDRRDAGILLAWFVGLTAVGVGDRSAAHRTARRDGRHPVRRVGLDVAGRPAHADARRSDVGRLDARRHGGQDRRDGRRGHRHAVGLAVLAGAADGRADPRAGGVDVHRRHHDRRSAAAGRRAAGGVAGRQQLPVRSHRSGRGVRRHRRRDLVAHGPAVGARRVGGARGGDRRRRRLLPHLPGHAPRHRRRRRWPARRGLRRRRVARCCAIGARTATGRRPRRRRRDRRPRRRPRRGGCRGRRLRRVGVAGDQRRPHRPGGGGTGPRPLARPSSAPGAVPAPSASTAAHGEGSSSRRAS